MKTATENLGIKVFNLYHKTRLSKDFHMSFTAYEVSLLLAALKHPSGLPGGVHSLSEHPQD